MPTSKPAAQLTKKKQKREAYSEMLRAIRDTTSVKELPMMYMDFGGKDKSKKTKP